MGPRPASANRRLRWRHRACAPPALASGRLPIAGPVLSTPGASSEPPPASSPSPRGPFAAARRPSATSASSRCGFRPARSPSRVAPGQEGCLRQGARQGLAGLPLLLLLPCPSVPSSFRQPGHLLLRPVGFASPPRGGLALFVFGLARDCSRSETPRRSCFPEPLGARFADAPSTHSGE